MKLHAKGQGKHLGGKIIEAGQVFIGSVVVGEKAAIKWR